MALPLLEKEDDKPSNEAHHRKQYRETFDC